MFIHSCATVRGFHTIPHFAKKAIQLSDKTESKIIKFNSKDSFLNNNLIHNDVNKIISNQKCTIFM